MPAISQGAPGGEQQLSCPGCGRPLNVAKPADLVCDGLVWCCACRRYGAELEDSRDLAELQEWAARLCTAFGQEPVDVLENPAARSDWRLYWQNDRCVLAEAYYTHRAILLYPPGQRLVTLCHELAHLFTGQDHTLAWAQTFAALVAWVRANIPSR
jgi:hypothetical protein